MDQLVHKLADVTAMHDALGVMKLAALILSAPLFAHDVLLLGPPIEPMHLYTHTHTCMPPLHACRRVLPTLEASAHTLLPSPSGWVDARSSPPPFRYSNKP
eukprot:1156288-Pelagomonas_calceolata.AAC.4